jgi:hypothetical protein
MMSPAKRYVKKHAQAKQRRRQAQHAVEALQQALAALGLAEDLVVEIEGRLRSQQRGVIVAERSCG